MFELMGIMYDALLAMNFFHLGLSLLVIYITLKLALGLWLLIAMFVIALFAVFAVVAYHITDWAFDRKQPDKDKVRKEDIK